MARDEAYSDDIDWLDVSGGDVPRGTPPRRPWPRWLTLAVTGAVIAVVVAVLNIERRDPAVPAAKPTTSASSSRPAPGTSAAPSPSPPVPPVVVDEDLGHPLLNATTGWELFARGPGVLARIQPAAGRLILSPIPDLRSGGPVSLLAGPDRVLIRPLDNVPAYLMRDGDVARELSSALNQGGAVFPGPSPGQMWVEPADDHEPVMALATLDGKRLAGFVRVPSGSSSMEAVADGGGYLLYPAVGGIYQARPEGLRRISTGVLLAVGPTGWLVIECDEQYHCQTVLINRADGRRQTVADRQVGYDGRGLISPDGSTVALLTSSRDGTTTGVTVLDLARGSWLRVPGLIVARETLTGAIAYSPDGKWLFAVAEDGTIAVINPRTSAVRTLDVALPTVTQLVVRPASHAPTAAFARPARSTPPDVAAALIPACCRPTERR